MSITWNFDIYNDTEQANSASILGASSGIPSLLNTRYVETCFLKLPFCLSREPIYASRYPDNIPATKNKFVIELADEIVLFSKLFHKDKDQIEKILNSLKIDLYKYIESPYFVLDTSIKQTAFKTIKSDDIVFLNAAFSHWSPSDGLDPGRLATDSISFLLKSFFAKPAAFPLSVYVSDFFAKPMADKKLISIFQTSAKNIFDINIAKLAETYKSIGITKLVLCSNFAMSLSAFEDLRRYFRSQGIHNLSFIDITSIQNWYANFRAHLTNRRWFSDTNFVKPNILEQILPPSLVEGSMVQREHLEGPEKDNVLFYAPEQFRINISSDIDYKMPELGKLKFTNNLSFGSEFIPMDEFIRQQESYKDALDYL